MNRNVGWHWLSATAAGCICALPAKYLRATMVPNRCDRRSKVERTYWGADHEVQSDEPPTCSSTDGVISINGDVCKIACPYQAFTDAPGLLTAEERKGKCTPGYRVMGISLTNMMPVFIRCSGISATAARGTEYVTGIPQEHPRSVFQGHVQCYQYQGKEQVPEKPTKSSSGNPCY